MKLIRLGAAAINQIPLDWEGNGARIRDVLAAARLDGVSILCLPEMCLCGYGCEDAFHAPSTVEHSWRLLCDLLPATMGMVVSFGLPIRHRNALFNCACLVVEGRPIGLVAKRHLAGDGIHYEPRWFKPWPDGVRAETETDGESIPLGDLVFEVGGVRIGFEICEDAWVATRPGGALAGKAVDVILNPSASHFAFAKLATREQFVREGSRAFGVSYVYANLLGNEAGRVIYDGGPLIAASGEIVAQGRRFSFQPFDLIGATVDVDTTRMQQTARASYRPALEEASGECVREFFQFPSTREFKNGRDARAAWESSPRLKEEEFTRALALALFDYLRKSRSHGFVVSLSGGADSSAVVALCRLMIDLALTELGPRGFADRLSHIPGIAECRDARDFTRRLLLAVYQATANSSDTTRDAARDVAEAVGATFMNLKVESLRAAYVSMIEQAVGRPLTWERDDLALQNIQARVRAPGVWMLANLRNALLLSTSNRSEAAVGYATMDGDTCGGLSPIAGIDKAFLRHWLRWMETDGPDGLAPIPALAAVNRQAPTAELRPADRHQTDEDDLMPYDVLDAIEEAAIRDHKTPAEAFAILRHRFPAHPAETLRLWVGRFFRLWCRNQWKRERYAPSFHLDDENLDPKTWCRFPILSGGYATELKELESATGESG